MVGRSLHRRISGRCRVLCPLSDCSSDEDKDARSDEASNRITDPTAAERDTEQAEQPAGDGCPDDAEHYVHHKPHLAFHELLGEPASNAANDDSCDPSNFRMFHGTLLSHFPARAFLHRASKTIS